VSSFESARSPTNSAIDDQASHEPGRPAASSSSTRTVADPVYAFGSRQSRSAKNRPPTLFCETKPIAGGAGRHLQTSAIREGRDDALPLANLRRCLAFDRYPILCRGNCRLSQATRGGHRFARADVGQVQHPQRCRPRFRVQDRCIRPQHPRPRLHWCLFATAMPQTNR
jgi:hypothetical protein